MLPCRRLPQADMPEIDVPHGQRVPARTRWCALVVALAALAALLPAGCSRQYWRNNADAEAYGLIREKTMLDGRWTPPRTDVIPSPTSRIFDPYDPDYGPLPADDPAASIYLNRVGDCRRIAGSDYWREIGMSNSIENPGWIPALAAAQRGGAPPNAEPPGPLLSPIVPPAPAPPPSLLSRWMWQSHGGLETLPRPAGTAGTGRAVVRLDAAETAAPPRRTAQAETSAGAGMIAQASFQEPIPQRSPTPVGPEQLPTPVGPEAAPALPNTLPQPPKPLRDPLLEDPDETLSADPGNAATATSTYTDAGPDIAAANPALPPVSDLTLYDAVQLSYLHSRDYQTTIENVFLASLDLAFQRFQFDVRFLGFGAQRPSGNTTFSDTPGLNDTVTTSNRIGISRLLPAGGQYVVELANNTLWLVSGGPQDSSGTFSSLSYSFVQPLLLGAGRKVVLEILTQAERTLLYQTRNLARFRQTFFVDTVTGGPSGGYLGLLQQIQSIANLEDNISRLEEQLEVTQASQTDVLSEAQLESQLLRNLNNLRSSRQQFQDQLDQYKIQLGLPPDLPMTVDTDLLRPFRLIDARLVAIERALNDEFLAVWSPLNPDDPEPERLAAVVALLSRLSDNLGTEAFGILDEDFAALKESLPSRLASLPDPASAPRVLENIQRDRVALARTRTEFQQSQRQVAALATALEAATTPAQRTAVYRDSDAIRRTMRRITGNLQGIQIGVRTELIELNPFELRIEEAVGYALTNRVDLMNQRAMVTDERRRVEVAGNQLRAGLNVRVEGNINTRPVFNNDNPFDFRGLNSNYRAGVEFVAPLDQIQQRNNYRGQQIIYQRARRAYMLFEDQVKFSVRTDWRQLVVLRENFEVARNAVRVAALQYDLAVEQLNAPASPSGGGGGGSSRSGGGGSSAGLNLIQALNNLLQAQNQIIGLWISYESARLNIYRDMGIMEIDAQGMWVEPFYQQGFASRPSGAVDPAARGLEGIGTLPEPDAAGIMQGPALLDQPAAERPAAAGSRPADAEPREIPNPGQFPAVRPPGTGVKPLETTPSAARPASPNTPALSGTPVLPGTIVPTAGDRSAPASPSPSGHVRRHPIKPRP